MNISKKSPVEVRFLGAAGTVTGSKHLLSSGGKNVLVDCGLFQGPKEIRQRNWKELQVKATEIDAVTLTHAHLDHTGYLPRLVQDGFSGPIYGTPATLELTKLILTDSAKLQVEESDYHNKHKTSKHHPALPLYGVEDVEKAITLFKPLKRDVPNIIFPEWEVTPRCAGHILGAVTLQWSIHNTAITFSGDIGRYDVPILPDPQPTHLGNLFICESTYGNREHHQTDVLKDLADVISQTIVSDGPLLIPAFSVGRTQLLLHYISLLENSGQIPEVPVFVDSPMAIDATEIYNSFRFDFDSDSQSLIKQGKDPLRAKRTHFLRSRELSMRLNTMRGPRVIIAGSGMVTGGRILHHLLHWLSKEETNVLFVGFQAPHTRGAKILKGDSSIRIFGSEVQVRAKVHEISGLSAHGDKNELKRWIRSCTGSPSQVKIVHGEPEAASSFAKQLTTELNLNASVARENEVVIV